MKGIKNKLIILGLICFLVSFIYFGFVWLPSKQNIYQEEYFIVDKYSEVRLGSTCYILLLDNFDEVSICRSYWLNYNIGDTYNITIFGWK